MKIFQVNDKFFQEGGTEVYIRQISKSLKKAGHKVIQVYGAGPMVEEVTKEGYTGYLIPGLEEEFPSNPKQVLIQIASLIEKEKPDVIQINNLLYGDFIAEFIKGAPTLRHVHDHRLYCPGFSKTWYNSNQICPIPFSYKCLINAYKEHCATNRPTKLLKKYQAKFHELDINRRLPKILLASEFMASQLLINEFDPKKFVVLPHFVDLPPKRSPTKEKGQILFVGRLTVEKGVKYAIEAMKDVAGQLTIVGTGPQEKEYKQLAKDLGISGKVKFVGEVSKNKIGQYYQNAVAVVFPSIWPEPHGKIGPEAFSYSRPVVGFDSGGVKEWLQDGSNGFLVPRLDTRLLTAKLNLLLSDPHLAIKLGENGRRFVEENMSEGIYSRKLLKVYQETIHLWQKEMVLA